VVATSEIRFHSDFYSNSLNLLEPNGLASPTTKTSVARFSGKIRGMRRIRYEFLTIPWCAHKATADSACSLGEERRVFPLIVVTFWYRRGCHLLTPLAPQQMGQRVDS
jgi:hypothetical protein